MCAKIILFCVAGEVLRLCGKICTQHTNINAKKNQSTILNIEKMLITKKTSIIHLLIRVFLFSIIKFIKLFRYFYNVISLLGIYLFMIKFNNNVCNFHRKVGCMAGEHRNNTAFI